MFTNISWGQYLTAILLLSTLYYFVVLIKYFKGDIKQLLSGKNRYGRDTFLRKDEFNTAEDVTTPGAAVIPLIADEETDLLFKQANELSGLLKRIIQDASDKNYIQEEFLTALHSQIKQYPALNKPAFREAINNLIVSETQKYGTHTLSESRMDLLWRASV